LFGCWVRDGHHVGPGAADAVGNAGFFFEISATLGTTAEPLLVWVQGDLIRFYALVAAVAGLTVRDGMRYILSYGRFKRLFGGHALYGGSVSPP